MIQKGKMTINDREYEVNYINEKTGRFVRMRDLEQAGFRVGYNVNNHNSTIYTDVRFMDITIDGEISRMETIDMPCWWSQEPTHYVPIQYICSALGWETYSENGKVVITKKELSCKRIVEVCYDDGVGKCVRIPLSFDKGQYETSLNADTEKQSTNEKREMVNDKAE